MSNRRDATKRAIAPSRLLRATKEGDVAKPRSALRDRKVIGARSRFDVKEKMSRGSRVANPSERTSESSRQRKKLSREEYGHED